jgi:CRISPR-associated endonuclease/helicase Cas3
VTSLSGTQEPAQLGASLGTTMTMITAVDAFDGQFAALVGPKPFRWQRRLFECFVKEDVPAALDLPTGLGKTSVIAIWLIARAHGAKLPRRLVYVVDRRAVVDQATAEAEKLRRGLDRKRDLKAKLGLGDHSLPISTLRGQFVDNRDWLADPAAPAIVIGTVDTIGSRLLFSGYGVSPKMRPYHAGFLGADTLVVLDEAHLVPPFERLLKAIERDAERLGPRAEEDRRIVPPFMLLSLSATGREREGNVFRLCDADFDDDIVKKRLQAKKSVEFVKLGELKLKGELARQAWQLADHGAANIRCLVYCESRETAEETKKVIEALADGEKPKVEVETELFVGARRVKEREDGANRLENLGFIAGQKNGRLKPAFLCATSAAEVGVDLDADHMVCDLAPWERMVQRFGRVNRRGDGNAKIIVVDGGEPRPKKPNEPTPKEIRRIIAYRALAAINELPKSERGFDGSPDALRDLKLRAEGNRDLQTKIEAATTPAPLRPALIRSLVDAWSMTSLPQHTGRPEIDPWLRGWIEDDEPQTSVVWRAHLPVRVEDGDASPKEVEDFFEAAPPHASEELETETYHVADWLMARASAVSKARWRRTEQDDGAHIEDAGEPASEQAANLSLKSLGANDIVAFALTPAGDLRNSYRLRDLAEGVDGKSLKDRLNQELMGTTLIVDARLKGLTSGLLDKTGDAIPRTADDGGDWLLALPVGHPVVGFCVHRAAASAATKTAAHETYAFVTRRSGDGEDLEILSIETWTTEESRAASINPQLLAEHHSWTEKRALAIAEAVGLTGDHKKALASAARLHDQGKMARRWQRAFNAPDGKIYAKTKGPISYSLLDGYRHEFGSLPCAEKDAAFRDLPPDLKDLVLHIIAAHHGRARPLIETTGCEDSPPSALEGRARDVALRFAKLQKRWGPWGLAWWEALLRAADQQSSRENDARAKGKNEDVEAGESL